MENDIDRSTEVIAKKLKLIPKNFRGCRLALRGDLLDVPINLKNNLGATAQSYRVNSEEQKSGCGLVCSRGDCAAIKHFYVMGMAHPATWDVRLSSFRELDSSARNDGALDMRLLSNSRLNASERDRVLFSLKSLAASGVTLLVNATEDPYTTYVWKQLGQRSLHLPIEDYHKPTLDDFKQIYTFITANVKQEGIAAIHCQAGLGRTGTLMISLKLAQFYEEARSRQEVHSLFPSLGKSISKAASLKNVPNELDPALKSTHTSAGSKMRSDPKSALQSRMRHDLKVRLTHQFQIAKDSPFLPCSALVYKAVTMVRDCDESSPYINERSLESDVQLEGLLEYERFLIENI